MHSLKIVRILLVMGFVDFENKVTTITYTKLVLFIHYFVCIFVFFYSMFDEPNIRLHPLVRLLIHLYFFVFIHMQCYTVRNSFLTSPTDPHGVLWEQIH